MCDVSFLSWNNVFILLTIHCGYILCSLSLQCKCQDGDNLWQRTKDPLPKCSLFGVSTVFLIGPCLAIEALQTGIIVNKNNIIQSINQSFHKINVLPVEGTGFVRLTPQSRTLRMTRTILLTLNSQYETLAQNWQHLTQLGACSTYRTKTLLTVWVQKEPIHKWRPTLGETIHELNHTCTASYNHTNHNDVQ